jgi:hypothetical protein
MLRFRDDHLFACAPMAFGIWAVAKAGVDFMGGDTRHYLERHAVNVIEGFEQAQS